MRPRVALRVGAAPPAAQQPFPLSSLRLSRSLHWPVGQATVVLPSDASLPAAGETVSLEGASDG
ncbi:MAG TPA: hypothetical protein VD902_13630, partial [Symbiobacteriaceae bacterium]|nr:hypothetical protein [Symbiobacteriaceae bacterium]